jgi:hypothetical protein
MKVNKADLLKALEVVKAGLSNNGILAQASSFAFTEGTVPSTSRYSGHFFTLVEFGAIIKNEKGLYTLKK